MKRKASPEQVSFVPPDAAAMLHLIRENLRLLGEIAEHYELPRMQSSALGPQLGSPSEVAAYLSPEMIDLPQEQLKVVILNTKHRVIAVQMVYQGTINSINVRLADCFREPVTRGAAAIILCHNHPSGDPAPSPEDIKLTQDAGQAGALLGIDVLDHIIVGREGYVSLRERGLYTPASRAA